MTLRQLLPGGGIWSVVAAQSAVFNIALHVNEKVEIGAEVIVHAGLEVGTEVAVGFAGTGSCDAFQEETVPVADFAVVAVVPEAMAGCTGYVYALTPSTPEGQIELGRIVFPCCGMNDKPALAYTIQAITAVPVTFVDPAETSSEPVQVGRIGCDGANPIVETPVVATQLDGIHVQVSNPTEQTISFSIGPYVADPDAAVSPLAPGTLDLVLTHAPGPMSFSCSPLPPEEGQAGVSGFGSFEVVDPAGNYVPADLECDAGSAYGSGAAQPAGGGGGGSGFAGDPVQVVRDHVSGLEFDDLVQRAGYVESEQPVIRIVRADAVVGKVALSNDGSGGWLMSAIEGCGGTQFGWSEEPTGVSGPMGPTGSDEEELCESVSHGPAELTGRDLEFIWPCLLVATREPISIRFVNEDVGVPRNVAVFAMTSCLEDALAMGGDPSCDDDLTDPIFRGEIVEGPATIVYEIGPLDPGRYYLHDEVHPTTANGVLIVR